MFTNNIVPFFYGYITEWRQSTDSFVKSEILTRVTYAALIPLSFVARTADTLVGGVATPLSWVTVRYFPTLNRFAFRQLSASKDIVRGVFYNILRTINPKVKIVDGHAFISKLPVEKLCDFANECTWGEGLEKHVVSRMFYVTVIPLVILYTRVMDFAIGVFNGIFAIVNFGFSNELNTLAYRGLKGPALICDIGNCISSTIFLENCHTT